MALSEEEKQVGQRIRIVRKEHGVSQRLAAAQMGVSRQQLDRIERGEVAVRLYPGISFCEFAEINPLWLAFGEPEKRYGCPNEEQMDAALTLDPKPRGTRESSFLEFMNRSGWRFRRVSLLYTSDREPDDATKKRLGRLSIKHYLIPTMADLTWDNFRKLLVTTTQSAQAKKDLSKHLGVTLAAISQWRSGASAPSAPNAFKILSWIGGYSAQQKNRSGAAVTAPARKRSKLRKSNYEKKH